PAFGVPSPYDGTGGGVLNFGRLTISGCTLSGNTAFGGPGGAIANFGTLAVSACTLSNNITTGGQGGGIYTAATLLVNATTPSPRTTHLQTSPIMAAASTTTLVPR